jgi:hypothetical protein
MTTQITISDLITSLRKASSNPNAHAEAQQHYFSPLEDNSVLVNRGSACCVAGDLVLQAHADASEEEIRAIINGETTFTPSGWVARELGLSYLEEILAFNSNTHHEIHAVLAHILEAGLHLPNSKRILLSSDSCYDSFDWAYLPDEDKYISLEEVLNWMLEIAE